jgi:hypothetical protein
VIQGNPGERVAQEISVSDRPQLRPPLWSEPGQQPLEVALRFLQPSHQVVRHGREIAGDGHKGLVVLDCRLIEQPLRRGEGILQQAFRNEELHFRLKHPQGGPSVCIPRARFGDLCECSLHL